MSDLVHKHLNPDITALLATLRLEIEQGKARALDAVDQEKKRTYWNIGKHIKTHILQNEDRADYGDYVFEVLAENLEMNLATLYLSVQFFETYPKILYTCRELSWSHFRVLLAIPDKSDRDALEAKIIKDHLSVRDLKSLIQGKGSTAQPDSSQALDVIRGNPYVYQLRHVHGKDRLDLGFHIYVDNPAELSPHLPSSSHPSALQPSAPSDPHYVYKAYLLEVVDGDTLWVDIDLGFDTITTQKIRLRGINCAELGTPEGESAKEYIMSRLKACKFLAIKTYWRDKYTRYLADLFYNPKESNLEALIQKGRFLNQELLDKKIATKY